MAAPEQTSAARQPQGLACYVYGIVPSDVEIDPDTRGVGDPPALVTIVPQGEIAALVSEIDPTVTLGRPEHLRAHEQLLDDAASEIPVLPFRFGAVLTDQDAVAEELLDAHSDEFLAALNELDGRAQYVVRGRYEQDAVLREALSENADAVSLLKQIQGKPADATRDERIALGEFINNAISEKREVDTQRLVNALAPLSLAVNVREPTHEQDAAYVAFLTDLEKQPELMNAVEELGRQWEGRVNLRVLGPMAAYDFVATAQGEEG